MFQFPAGSNTAPLTTAVARPIESSLTGISSGDPDAAAYIALIEGDGVSVSGAQKTAIDTFYVTGKNEGWYTHLKRAYFPVWGAAAPNARCLVSGTSGTFVGSVSQSAGFIEGGGGYFKPDSGGGLDDLSLTQTNCHMALLVQGTDYSEKHYAGNEASTSSFQAGGRFSFRFANDETDVAWQLHSNSMFSTPGAPRLSKAAGIFVGTGNANVSTTLFHQGGPNFQGNPTASSENTKTQNAASLPTGEPFLLARSINGAASSLRASPIKAGFWSYGTSLHANRAEFANAMKTLFETVTGLTLPQN